jgi:Phage major coat protein, Gp8
MNHKPLARFTRALLPVLLVVASLTLVSGAHAAAAADADVSALTDNVQATFNYIKTAVLIVIGFSIALALFKKFWRRA